MRTTLTLEPDVAKRLQHLRQKGNGSLKEAVNTALRAGLDALDRREEPPSGYQTTSVSLGGCLVGQVDNVHEVLSVVEGDRRV